MKNARFAILFLLASSVSFAGSGNGIVPWIGLMYLSSGDYLNTSIYITNITNDPVKVTITCYGLDGAVIPETNFTYYNFSNSNTEIAGRKTVRFVIMPPVPVVPFNYGHATIEWEDSPGKNNTVALVAFGAYSRVTPGTDGRHSITINNGLPF
jgi:hypothetical protein